MKKYLLIIFLFIFLFIATASVSYFFNIYKKVFVGSESKSPQAKTQDLSPTPTPDPLGPRNILILGYGGELQKEGSLLTDTIILAHLVPRESKITLISIPRDILVPLNIKEGQTKMLKINHAFAIGQDDRDYPDKPEKYQGSAGGGNMAKDAVGFVTGMRVDNFVAIDFIGFVNIVDTLGGISVNVPYSFTDKFYPLAGEEDNPCGKSDEEIKALSATMSGELLEQQFPCRFETLNFVKGKATLDGKTSLKFVRSRHSETGGSDFGRAQRQQAFLVAMKNKLLSYQNIPKLISITNTLSKNVRTDIDIKTAIDLLREQTSLSDVAINTISLNIDNVLEETYAADGQYILVPKEDENNWDKVQDYIIQELEKN